MTPGQRSGLRLSAFLLPFLAAVTLYAVTLRYDLTFDDKAHMEPPGVEETRTWTQVWKEPSLFYRPVVTSTFWVETRYGFPLWSRHGLNVLLHGIVTLLVVRLALGLGLTAWISCGIGLLFAVHPAHVEAVAGIVGRADLLAALWLLLALWLHERAMKTGNWRPVIGWALLLAFLAANSKESTWGLPAFAVVLHLAWRRSPVPLWPLFAAYGLGIGGHLILRQRAIGSWLTSPRGDIPVIDNPLVALEGMDRLIGGLKVAGLNLAHLVFPVTLAPDYSGYQIDVSGGVDDLRFWGGMALVLGSVLVMLRGFRRFTVEGRTLILGGGWLLISAFMVMNIIYTIETVLADRLLYWPSVAWVLLLGAIASGALGSTSEVPSRSARRRTAIIGAMLLMIVAGYTLRAARYIPIWENNKTLFEAAVVITPNVPRAWYNLGFEFHYEGEFEKAIVSYRKARDLSPSQESWAHEAAALMQLGRWDEAEEPLSEALRLNPRDVISLVNSGIFWLHEDSVARATGQFEAALELDSTRTEAWYNLGLAWDRLDRHANAEAAYRHGLDLDPEDIETMGKLAEVLFKQGRRVEAVELAREILGLEDSPTHREQLQRFLDEKR